MAMGAAAAGDHLPILERYVVEKSIGFGKYGKVFSAIDKASGERVAVKRVEVNLKEKFIKVTEPDGRQLDVPFTIGMEIKLLRRLRHENVIQLLDVVYRPTEIFLIFEYMEHDLCGLNSLANLTPPQIKCLLRQLLRGMHFIHHNFVMHRDIKSANILVNSKGQLKIADFGMATPMPVHGKPSLELGVITLWSRPPELFLGFTDYSYSADMWSVGCVFGEMLTGKALMGAMNEHDQLYYIFHLCGTPDEVSWPEGAQAERFKSFMRSRTPKASKLREVLKGVDPLAVDLLESMLQLNPAKRISPAAALDSDYLWADPMPCSLADLPVKGQPYNELLCRMMNQRRPVNEAPAVQGRDAKRQRVDAPPPGVDIVAGIRVPRVINVPCGIPVPAAKSSSQARREAGVTKPGKAPQPGSRPRDATVPSRGTKPTPGKTTGRGNTTRAAPATKPKVEKGDREPRATLAF